MDYNIENPFKNLPQSLIGDMLSHYRELGKELIDSFNKIQKEREKIRSSLKSHITRDSSIIGSRVYPTTCGIDGAYTIERLHAVDIASIASVAVEGLTPPTEKRYWPEPHHLCEILRVNHNPTTFLAMRAIMLTMELKLATDAPHDVIFLDGSLATPVIHFNQAFSRLDELPDELAERLLKGIEDALINYEEILLSAKSDKIYVGIPKYTSRNEVAVSIGLQAYEDRALLSFVLDDGEIVGPLDFVSSDDYWHFVDSLTQNINRDMKRITNNIITVIKQLKVVYYRPYSHMPTLRIEIPPVIADNRNRLSVLFEALQLQCIRGIMEPYPLYLADRMVKHLGIAIPAIRRAVIQDMLSMAENTADIFLAMHSYRTEQS